MSDLNGLHEAISTTLRTAMPQLASVASYTAQQPGTPLPALFHGLVGLRPGTDPGDGRVCVVATFEARIVVDAGRTAASIEAASLAAQAMVVLHQQYWGSDFAEPTKAIRAVPHASEWPAALWTVQWEQVLYLGDEQWPWPDQPPGSLVFAFDPDSGPGKEADYKTPEDFA